MDKTFSTNSHINVLPLKPYQAQTCIAHLLDADYNEIPFTVSLTFLLHCVDTHSHEHFGYFFFI